MLSSYLPQVVELWALGIIVLLMIRLWFWQPRDFFGRLWHKEFILLGISLIVGYLYGMVGETSLQEPLVLNQVEVRGVLETWGQTEGKAVGVFTVEELAGNPGTEPKSVSVTSSANSVNVGQLKREIEGRQFRLTVYTDKEGKLPDFWNRVQPGDGLNFSARLERLKPSGTSGGFDARLYYSVRGLSGTLTARSDARLISLGKPPLTWRIRQRVTQILQQQWTPQDTGVLEGILFGDAGGIPPDVEEQYKITGVLHVFAASGSNVAFVLALAWGLLRFLPQSIRIAGTILALVVYAGLCGDNPPIVRATVLGIAVLLGRLGRGKVSSFRWLFFAALGLFLHNPLVLQDIGFQLSFAAAWGIMVLVPRFQKGPYLQKLPTLVRTAVATTLAAQLATLPLLISAFHRLSLIGFLTNLFILVLLGSVLELGLLGVLFSFSLWLAIPLFQVSLWLLQMSNGILEELARLPWADVWVLQPGWAFMPLWYGGLAVWLQGWEKGWFVFRVWERKLYYWIGKGSQSREQKAPDDVRGKAWNTIKAWSINKYWLENRVLATRGLFLVLLLLLLWSPWSAGDLEVTFLDVGQGDALLIRTPNQHVFLVDAGPKSDRFDAGERIVLPYLLQNRIPHLEALFITHEDMDHIGGARAILNNIPVDWVGIPEVGERLTNPEWQKGLPPGLLAETGRFKTLKTGDRVELDTGVRLEVLAPKEVLAGTHSDSNNNSLVLRLNYEGQSVVLSADMEQEEMNEIEESLGKGGWDADFYKEPHHGSRFSLVRPLLDSLNPKAVFISVGKNSFGHPSAEVLRYWADRHIPLYRTDEDGTIRLRLNKHGAEISTGRK
ncbi:MAG: DNA internalization-related competence protein ComEC/Rec2 [Desulfitobacteriaceae bacterium]